MTLALRSGKGMAVIIAAMSIALPVVAQTYPAKPVRMIVPFAAGGGVDLGKA